MQLHFEAYRLTAVKESEGVQEEAVDDLRTTIPCVKCRYPETDVIEAHVELGPDAQGNRIHQSTIFTLRCRDALCGHVFQKKVAADEPVI